MSGAELKTKKILDEDLAGLNDATAAAVGTNHVVISVCPHFYNAVICEVQAWRRRNPGSEFVSGPNVIRDSKD